MILCTRSRNTPVGWHISPGAPADTRPDSPTYHQLTNYCGTRPIGGLAPARSGQRDGYSPSPGTHFHTRVAPSLHGSCLWPLGQICTSPPGFAIALGTGLPARPAVSCPSFRYARLALDSAPLPRHCSDSPQLSCDTILLYPSSLLGPAPPVARRSPRTCQRRLYLPFHLPLPGLGYIPCHGSLALSHGPLLYALLETTS